MKARLLVLAPLLAVLLGCSNPVEQPAASCVRAAALLDGYLYAGGGPASADQAGAAFAVVQRSRECQDVIVTVNGQPSPTIEAWRDGDAHGFAAGTQLYTAAGHPDGSRLVGVMADGSWVTLQRQERYR